MFDLCATLRYTQFIIFEFVRRPQKQPEVFRHFLLHRYSEIKINAFADQRLIELTAQFIATDIRIYHQGVFIIPVNGSSEHGKILFHKKIIRTGSEIPDVTAEACGLKRTKVSELIRITTAYPIAIKFNVKRCFERNAKATPFEAKLSRIGVHKEPSWRSRRAVGHGVEPVGVPDRGVCRTEDHWLLSGLLINTKSGQVMTQKVPSNARA